MSGIFRLINVKRNSLNKSEQQSPSISCTDLASPSARYSRVSVLRQSISLRSVTDTLKRLVDTNPAKQSKLCEDVTEGIFCQHGDAETDPPLSEPPAYKTKITTGRQSKGKRQPTPEIALVASTSFSIVASSTSPSNVRLDNRINSQTVSHTVANQTTRVRKSASASQLPQTPPRKRRDAVRHVAWNMPGANIAYGWPKGVQHASAARLPSWFQPPQPRFEAKVLGEADGAPHEIEDREHISPVPTAGEHRPYHAHPMVEREPRPLMQGPMQGSDTKFRTARLREFMQHPQKPLAEQEQVRKAQLNEHYRMDQLQRHYLESERCDKATAFRPQSADSASATSANDLMVKKASRFKKCARRWGNSHENSFLSSRVRPSTSRTITATKAMHERAFTSHAPEHRLFQSKIASAEATKQKGDLDSPSFPEVVTEPMAPIKRPLREDSKYARVADWSMSVSSQLSCQSSTDCKSEIRAITGPMIKFWSLQDNGSQHRAKSRTRDKNRYLTYPLTEQEQHQQDAIFARYSKSPEDGSLRTVRCSLLDEMTSRQQELSDSLRKMPGAFLVDVDDASDEAASNHLQRSVEPDGSKLIGMGDYIWRTVDIGQAVADLRDPEQPCTLIMKYTDQLDMPRSPSSVGGRQQQVGNSTSGNTQPSVTDDDSGARPIGLLATRGPTATELVHGHRIPEASSSTQWLLAEPAACIFTANSAAIECSSSTNETRNTAAASSCLLASQPITGLTSATNSLTHPNEDPIDTKDLGRRLRLVDTGNLLRQTEGIRARSGSLPGEASSRIEEKVLQRQRSRSKTARQDAQPKTKIIDTSKTSSASAPVDLNDPCFRQRAGMVACSTCGRHYSTRQEIFFFRHLGSQVCKEMLSHSHNQWPRQGRTRPPDVRSMTMALDQDDHRAINPAFVLTTHASTCYIMKDDYRSQGLYAFLPVAPGDKYPFTYTYFSRSPKIRSFSVPGVNLPNPWVEEVELDIKKTGTFCAEVIMHDREAHRWRLYYRVEAPRGSYRQDRLLSLLTLVFSPELLRPIHSSRSSLSLLLRKRGSLRITKALQWVAEQTTRLQPPRTVPLDTLMLVEVAKMLFAGVHPNYMDVLRWFYTYRMQIIADSDQAFPASSLLPEAPYVTHVMQTLEAGA